MNTVKTLPEFNQLLQSHFASYNCNNLDASRESILSLIPRLACYTQINVDSISVYCSRPLNKTWIIIHYYLPLLKSYVDVTSKVMTPMCFLGFMSNISRKQSTLCRFYNV